jgi:broad specificity phosphatase PhoE
MSLATESPMPSSLASRPASLVLYLIRHGETTYNAEGRIQGQSDAPLSDLGHRQSQAAAESLAALPVEAVYSSPLSRAMETARRIAEKHRLTVQTDPRLMELNAGVFERRLRSELADAYPTELAQWLGGDEDFVIPGGESRRQLTVRGCEAIRLIASAGHREVVVVAHGGLLSATLRSLLNMEQPLPPFSLQNGSITRVTVDDRGQFALVSLNEVEHLRMIGISDGGDL